MMNKYVTQYFTILSFILMGVMMIGIDTAMAHHGWEEPNSDAVWFTTLPPPIHTDVADAITNGTLKAAPTGLRRNKSYYFNLYVVDNGSSANFYFADPTNPNGPDGNILTTDDNYLTECTVNTDCTSAMMVVYSKHFGLCIVSSLLHSDPGNVADPLYLIGNKWRPRIMGCSDADTCEGKVRGGRNDNGNLYNLIHFRTGKNGYCWSGGVTSDWATGGPTGIDSPRLAVDAPIYFRFINIEDPEPDFTNIVADFTVGVKVTGGQ